jgi:GNAT superfamily N-acetyltransferase
MSTDELQLVDLPTLPDGYSARPPRRDEAPALVDLMSAIEVETSGKSDITLNDFLGDWEGIDLETGAILITAPDGSPAAYADMDMRGDVVFFIYGYVHPFQRGKGLGTYLIAWGENRARALAASSAPDDARIVTRLYINEQAGPARALLSELGYAPIRATYTMAIDLERKPPVPQWPEGITIRNFTPGVDDQAAYEAYEEAFADMWQRPRGTFEQFSSKLRRPYFNPKLWFLAMDGDEVAGTLFSDDIDGKGWIEIVGVRRPWRGRGLALAMLHHSFGAFLSQGVTHIGLSVDAQSPTGAPKIYERAGMSLDQSFILYERELRPGRVVGAGPTEA